MADDLAVMGASPEVVQAVQDSSPRQDFEVWPDNMAVVELFMRLQTQWVPSMGGVLGLNYQSVEFLFKIEKIENQREMLADLQLMEVAALRVMNTKD